MSNSTHAEIAAALNAIIATVPTNVESPVPSQPRLFARADAIWNGSAFEAVQVRIHHRKHSKQAEVEINAYKRALVQAFKASGYAVFRVKGAGLRFIHCSSIGRPKDGLAWDLEVRVAAEQAA